MMISLEDRGYLVAEEFRGNQNQDQDYLLRKLITEKHVITILKYIRDKQQAASITKEEIARYMNENEICSRPTTLKIIQRLLDHKIILNDKIRDNTFSRIIINPSFDFGALEMDLLTSYIKETQQHFADFSDETRGVNTTLVAELLKSLQDFSRNNKKVEEVYYSRRKKEETFTPKQMEKIMKAKTRRK